MLITIIKGATGIGQFLGYYAIHGVVVTLNLHMLCLYLKLIKKHFLCHSLRFDFKGMEEVAFFIENFIYAYIVI